MAIRDGIKNAVTANVAAVANRTIRAGLRKVAGNLLGISTSGSGPQLGKSQPRAASNKYTTESLSYPLDVEEDPRQGHYIFFNINVQDKAKIAKQSLVNKVKHHEKRIQAEYKAHLKKVAKSNKGATDFDVKSPNSLEQIRQDYIKEHVIDGFEGYKKLQTAAADAATANQGRKDSSALALQSPTTSRIKTAIALYMPPSVSVSYGANYNDTEIGILADVGSGIIQAFKEGADAKKTAMDTLGKFEVGAKKMALAALDVAAPGSAALAQIQTGRAVTPKMELMFNGIGRRNFSYEFEFIPKSKAEAQMVEKIVYQFKYHMASDFIEGTGMREMEIPSTFDIAYHYLGGENSFLNKISTCVLESVDIAYGGDRFIAYEPTDSRLGQGAPPQKTKLSLKFKEMEIITKSRIEEGY